MITEKVIIVAIICVTLCFTAWCGTRKPKNDDRKDDQTNER